MTPERFARLQALFEQAVQLEPQARPAFLDRECEHDASLRAEVETLLAAEVATDEGFGRLMGRAVRDALESGIDIAGRRIGPYRIIETIGQGGMGAVYLAERADDQYRGQVAIKLSNTLFATPGAIERLRAERQILANLDHPNIARLLDGGTTAEGMPYLIMEYIEGVPIDVYCDRRKLGLSERLALFCDVCAAIQYAHQHLVVHRDIKPSNILVTVDGRAKLLDFGIAKLLDDAERSARALQHTVAEQRMLSPEYASPEHIVGLPITTASDIYSLGVLLYKLLCGHLPYEYGGHTLLELAELVAAGVSAQPSVKATSRVDGAPTPAVIAHARRTTPEKLARALRGDLDTIVMMALRKEPERRYRSAIQFADDIRRHLTGLPVTARRDTWTYRSGKFVRRHPFGVATAIVSVLLLASYAGTLWVQNERIRVERERAEAAAEFLVGLFEMYDPSQAQGHTPTVPDILAQGEQRVDALTSQPELQAQLRDALGRVYYFLGDYDEARKLLERARDQRVALDQTQDVAFAQTLSSLAATYFETGRSDDAERLQRQALDIVSHRLGAASLSTAQSMVQLGRVLRDRGQLDDAEKALDQAIRILETKHDAPDESLSIAQNFLASLRVLRGDLDGAEGLYTRMLDRDRKRLGPDHPLVLKNLASLAVVLEQRGDFGRARCTYLESLQGMRRVLPAQHTDIADVLNGLARVLMQLGDLPGAEQQFRAALAIDRGQRGDSHWTVAYDEANLAAVLHLRGDLQQSEALFREALGRYERDPAWLSYVAAAQQGLGDTLTDEGHYEDAGQVLAEAAHSLAQAQTAPAPWIGATQQALEGRLALAVGRYDDAQRLLTTALAQLEATRDAKDLRVRRTLRALVDVYQRLGQAQQVATYRARLDGVDAQVAQLASADCASVAALR